LDVEAVDEEHKRAQQKRPQLKAANGARVDDVRDIDGPSHIQPAR
jgi:hypothetical protein